MKNRTLHHQTHPTSNASWLRTVLFFGLALIFASINFSCTKENPTPTPTTPDEYYVKYIISSSTIYTGGKLNLTIRDEKDKYKALVVNQNSGSSIVIGPVSKGFNSVLYGAAAGTTFGKLKLYTEIHISKNNGPFAMKKINGSDTPRDTVEIAYTIDF